MVHYCCCGKIISEECQCDWTGWHDLEKNEEDLPKKNGNYQVRIFEDGEAREDESMFDVKAKHWGDRTNKSISQWEKEYYDGYIEWSEVYAWKESVEN